MSELSASHLSPGFGQKSLVRLGGSLGIAATCISTAIFTIGCFGFSAVFIALPLIPLLLSIGGLVLTVVGATLRRSPIDEDTQVLASIFVNTLGLLGAILELAMWQNWPIFFQQGTTGT
jgi:hypothetical protein